MRPAKPPQRPDGIQAPGLTWRPRADHWTGYWIPRQDIASRGYPIKSRQIWPPSTRPSALPNADEWLAIASNCQLLQDEMLTWGKACFPDNPAALFDDTISSLARIYLNDKDSPFRELRHHTRLHYESKLSSIIKAVGGARVSALTFRDFKRWHENWRLPAIDGGKDRIARAHGFMSFVRIAFSFGTLLKLPGCAEAKSILDEMEFENPKRRKDIVDAEQATKIRIEAHRAGLHSIALAQALQFDLMLRQKDAIGEWIPLSEPGLSDIMAYEEKWLNGLRWDEIDENLILTHRVSKSIRGKRALGQADAGKVKTWNLTLYPMVREELALIPIEKRNGPLIVAEHTGLPWRQKMFAAKWRLIARAAGVPESVQNRDSRAGGATEADGLQIDVETTRKAMGHARADTTRIYTRNETEATAQVAILRMKAREKKTDV